MPEFTDTSPEPNESDKHDDDLSEITSPDLDDSKTEELLSFILTNSTDTVGRNAALQELSIKPQESVLMALCEHILLHPDDTIKFPVADLISKIQPSEVMYNLCLAAEQSRKKEIQRTALDLLSRMQNPIAEEFLKDFLDNLTQRPKKCSKNTIKHADELAQLIAGNISLFGSKELSLYLANEVFPKYPSEDVRVSMALSIPAARFRECAESLFRALDDKSLVVQLCAQTVLMSLDDSEINNRIMRKLFL